MRVALAKRLTFAVLGIPAVVLAVGTPTESPTTGPSETPGRADGETNYRILAGAVHQFEADIDDSDADFALDRYGLGSSVHYALRGTDFSFDHSFVYEYDQYDFSGAAPWDDTHLLSYSMQANYALDRDWTVYAGPIIGMAAESGADMGEAITFGGSAGVVKQISPDLTLGLGAVALQQLEDDASVFPIVIVEWHASDQLRVRNARPQPGLRGGAGIEAAYALTANWELAAGGAYDTRRFRLDTADAVGENSSFPIFLRMTYRPTDDWSVSAIGGFVLGGELRLEDDDGDRIDTRDYSSAPFLGIAATYRF